MTTPSSVTSTPMARSPEMPPPPLPAPRASSHVEDIQTPQFSADQCRYFPPVPEHRDHRCACAGFRREKEFHGPSCDHSFGHLARFYSVPNGTPPPPGENQGHVELLKQRLDVLEQQVRVDREQNDLNQVTSRVRQLEDKVERNRDELQNEIQALCRNVSHAWLFIEDLQRRMAAADEVRKNQNTQLSSLRNSNLELQETNEMLEERIEKLEGMDEILSLATEPPLCVRE